jgi:ADP-ribose pyrophosphatase
MEQRLGPEEWPYQGRTISVRVDPVQVNTVITTREVVVRVPAVAVLAETEDSRLVVIKQHRWAVRQTLFELPAGKMDHGEGAIQAAKRELLEETGYQAEKWQLVTTFYPSPGYTDEKVFLYHASGLSYSQSRLDADEEIETELWTLEDTEHFVQSTQGVNGIALIGLQWWLCRKLDRSP